MNDKQNKIIVTGILGQDGSNMVEYLLRNTNSQIYGMMRRSANPNFINCNNFINHDRFKFVYGDLTDSVSLDSLVSDIKPDYIIACYDLPKPTYRHEAYKDYKAGRAKTDDELVEDEYE